MDAEQPETMEFGVGGLGWTGGKWTATPGLCIYRSHSVRLVHSWGDGGWRGRTRHSRTVEGGGVEVT